MKAIRNAQIANKIYHYIIKKPDIKIRWAFLISFFTPSFSPLLRKRHESKGLHLNTLNF